MASNLGYSIIGIDTNQGVYGLGEVRDGGILGRALVLKLHLAGPIPSIYTRIAGGDRLEVAWAHR